MSPSFTRTFAGSGCVNCASSIGRYGVERTDVELYGMDVRFVYSFSEQEMRK